MPTIKTGQTKVDVDSIYGITDSGQQVLDADRDRRSLSIQNVGDTKVYVSFGDKPVTSFTKLFSYILAT